MDFSSLYNKITDDILEQIKKQNGYNASLKKRPCETCKEPEKPEPKSHWLDKFNELWNSFIFVLNDKSYFVQTQGLEGEIMTVEDNCKYTDLICIDSNNIHNFIIDDEMDYTLYFYIPNLTVISTEYSIIHLTKNQGKDILRKIKEDIENNDE